ncbi:MAG TPA: type II toxin-antitoxin system RelE/ParE family toxin [Pyrinomonadaceae bacterium]|nr:type II toxin-antitoxin system RelE/ParE family toxin [Pyrinomonadaceae bacterium]
MRIEFHPEALDEYLQAALWYANREPTIAEQFISSIEEAIKQVSESPSRWRLIDEDVRRCLAHVFPYAILYTIENDFILVVAVMHCSREPDYWKLRMK